MDKKVAYTSAAILAIALIFVIGFLAGAYINQNAISPKDRYYFSESDGYITSVADKLTGDVRYATGQYWNFMADGGKITGGDK